MVKEFRNEWLYDNLHAIPQYDCDKELLTVRPYNDVATHAGGFTIKCVSTVYIPFYYKDIRVAIKSLTFGVQT